MNERVIYFSLNATRKSTFYKFIKQNGICYRPKFSFSLEGEEVEFNDPRDLITLIEETTSDRDSLHIIIDYVSCCVEGMERNYSTALRDIIMCYPEVQFLFDETFVRKRTKEKKEAEEEVQEFNFLNFLFWKAIDDERTRMVLADFHQFDLGDYDDETVTKQFVRLLKGCNNIFDGSNLRYAIRSRKFATLNVVHNYGKMEESRRSHAAVVVEEEYHQNMYNSYCMYANGYRVFPILTATELLWINDESQFPYLQFESEEKENRPLLIRDYDLQFIDEGLTSSGIVRKKGENEIDYIRGAKAERQKVGNLVKIVGYSIIDEDDNQQKNRYWRSFDKSNTYFVSKGDDNVKISLKFKTNMETDGKVLNLRGIKKPLEGIYASVQKIDVVRRRYKETQYDINDEGYKIDIMRIGDLGHSCPLDIYGIARSMVRRSERYYHNGRYRLAALASGEALFVLNGFHRSLMNKAYHILSISENAMAVSLLGGNEDMLNQDVYFRLKGKVRSDVMRMIADVNDRYNLLYNIFNDCMLFCKEKEYFEAADEALSVMVHEKEGVDIIGWIKKVKSLFVRKKTKNRK